MIRVHADVETHAQDAFFARRERGQIPRGGFAQVGLDGGVESSSSLTRVHSRESITFPRGRSNCGAIQAAAGSASRKADNWRNTEAGSTPG